MASVVDIYEPAPEPVPGLGLELGQRVLDDLDLEQEGYAVAVRIRGAERDVILAEEAANEGRVQGYVLMAAIVAVEPPGSPPMPAMPGPFTVDRTRTPVAELEPTKPKRRRVRKAKTPKAVA